MIRKQLLPLLIIILSTSCSKQQGDQEPAIMSMQLIDRNGITETISTNDKLSNYQNVDFLAPQPFKKLLRVYEKNKDNKSPAVVTSYHPNGYIWQYLEIFDGRSKGKYKEWYDNGNLKMELQVIEGLADLTEAAQASWIFDQKCYIWDENQHKLAEIYYEKGALQGESIYYHPNGCIEKIIHYHNNEIDGSIEIFDQAGSLIEKKIYENGVLHGESFAFWQGNQYKYREKYNRGLLQSAAYFLPDGNCIHQVTLGNGKQAFFKEDYLYQINEIKNGIANGKFETYHPNGHLESFYTIKDGKKEGEEWMYYPLETSDSKQIPQLYIFWRNDAIQEVKTWYPNGQQETQKEMHNNKKHGISFAWYQDGSLMLMEEYDNEKLSRGSYYKRNEPQPTSKVESGAGIATLFDSHGHFIQKITYDHGRPITESIH